MTDLLVNGTSIDPVPGSYTFSGVTADHTIEAIYTQTHILTPTSGENGMITPSEPVVVDHGADFSFTITPDEGYGIADVLIDSGKCRSP